MLRLHPTLLLVTAVLAACADGPAGDDDAPAATASDETAVPTGAEAVSLTGAPLVRPELEPDLLADRQEKYEAARVRREADPGDVDARIWEGRRLGYLGRYRDAVATFTDAMALDSTDARLWRHRGHRHITLRELEEAEADLQHAARLVEGQPDVGEPDGLPNARGIPTSTLQGNIWYHLGLAHYLQGEFEQALLAYREGMKVAEHDDMKVAMTYWLVNTLLRLGREEAAETALAAIHAGMDVIESGSYMDVLELHKGLEDPEELLGPGGEDATLASTTTAYGVGNWHFVNGRREAAFRIWERVLEAEEQWPAFGYIAAEAELARAERS